MPEQSSSKDELEAAPVMISSFLMATRRRKPFFLLLSVIAIYLVYQFIQREFSDPISAAYLSSAQSEGGFDWKHLPERYRLREYVSPPLPLAGSIPKIQSTAFPKLDDGARAIQTERLAAVKSNFTHAWKGYKDHAWLKDEVAPITGGYHDAFGGWGATLVDSLGTLWIMGLRDEFEEAVQAIEKIDFSTCALKELNVFETTIRYLGGFLSAYDLSEGKYPTLLNKAEELGEMLYHAFDTPNRMPVTRWNFHAATRGTKQAASSFVLVAEIGSLTLEFTRLTQLTGNDKYYDAIMRIMDAFAKQQKDTTLPGMWPVVVNPRDLDFSENTAFTIGGMADSLYEYLPKQHLLLGGGTLQYKNMYELALKPMKEHIFYRPSTPNELDILLAGQITSDGITRPKDLKTEPEGQHLACFAGGMVGLASRLFDRPEDMGVARRLVEGCLWGYESMIHGIMPEVFHTLPCLDKDCKWDEARWHAAMLKEHPQYSTLQELLAARKLPPGMTRINDARYILRPEAIESVFYLYRMTGDQTLLDRAWRMFENIIKLTKTDIAHAGLNDCTVPNPPKQDKMESFWLAETLRYFYLIFSDPDLVSLDEFVLNTEAHPLRRPV